MGDFGRGRYTTCVFVEDHRDGLINQALNQTLIAQNEKKERCEQQTGLCATSYFFRRGSETFNILIFFFFHFYLGKSYIHVITTMCLFSLSFIPYLYEKKNRVQKFWLKGRIYFQAKEFAGKCYSSVTISCHI